MTVSGGEPMEPGYIPDGKFVGCSVAVTPLWALYHLLKIQEPGSSERLATKQEISRREQTRPKAEPSKFRRRKRLVGRSPGGAY